MKRLYIIVEGKTEFEFINELLCPFFSSIEIYQVTPLLLNTSKTQKVVIYLMIVSKTILRKNSTRKMILS